MKNLIALGMVFLIISGCSESVDDLIDGIQSDKSMTRRIAAGKLTQKAGNPEVTAKLLALLGKGDQETSFIVTQILGSLADTTAIDPLCEMLDNPNKHIRVRAAWSLGGIGNFAAIPCLAKALNDVDSDVRYRAVLSLGVMHDESALPHIYSMFRDDADSVRAAAIQSVYYYRAAEGTGVLAQDLALTLNDKSDQVRYVAVQALGGSYPDSTVAGDLLIEALKDENKEVRIEAIRSLKMSHNMKCVPILKQMYDTATVDEEIEITIAIKEIANEVFPSFE